MPAVHLHGLVHLNLVHLLAPISSGRRDHHGVGLLSLHHSIIGDHNVTTTRELGRLIPLAKLWMLLEII
jgi:hypothetical protein